MPKKDKHHSHTHNGVTVDSTTVSHAHYFYVVSSSCGGGAPYHGAGHLAQSGATNSHQHTNCVLSFGSAGLGSPWWNHKHPITLTSIDMGGASHYLHSVPANTGYTLCAWCLDEGAEEHRHGFGSPTIGWGGASHTHGLTGNVTDNADPAGTPENHTHSFTVPLDQGNSHSHTLSTTTYTAYALCGLGADHMHYHSSPSQTVTHSHNLTGNSGAGGEPLPVVAQPLGDGITFTV